MANLLLNALQVTLLFNHDVRRDHASVIHDVRIIYYSIHRPKLAIATKVHHFGLVKLSVPLLTRGLVVILVESDISELNANQGHLLLLAPPHFNVRLTLLCESRP